MKKFFTVIAAVLFTGSMMAATTMTCADAATAALSVSADNELYNNGVEIEVTGYVTSIQTAFNAQYSNVSFWMDDTKGGSNVIEAFRAACASAADAPSIGDKVKVTGKLTKYGTTPEFAAGCTFVIEERDTYVPQNLGYKTIAEFLQIKSVKDTCILRGAIANIVMDKDDATLYNKYGNFDLVDATGSLYIYGLLTPEGEAQQFREMGLNEGDSITIKAIYTEHQGNPQAKNAILVDGGEITPVEEADVVFTSADFNGLGHLWTSEEAYGDTVTVTKDGVTFTCDVAGGDKYGVRCYKGSNVTITSAEQQIGKIVFEFGTASGKYYNGDLDEEIVVNGMEWTNTMASQARMNKISIYFGTAEEPEKPVYPENPEGVITCAEAAELAAAVADPTADNKNVEVQAVKVRGFVTFCYAASEGKQSAWIADDQKATAGTVQGYNLEVPEEVAKGDYVELDGSLVKYFKAGKDGKADEIILEVINGTMTKIYPEAIENVVLTEKAQKVMIDGNIYIIRDGKMFDIRGTQVR